MEQQPVGQQHAQPQPATGVPQGSQQFQTPQQFQQPGGQAQLAPTQQAQPAPTQQAQGSSYGGPTFAAGIPTQAGVSPQQVSPQQSTASWAGSSQQLMSQPTELYPEEFADHLTDELRDCLDDSIDVSQVAAWCADRCLEQGGQYAQCSRLCNDAATLAAVTAEFIAKDAMTLPAVLDAYVETAQHAADELENFDTPHTNEAEMVLERSIDSSLEALDSF